MGVSSSRAKLPSASALGDSHNFGRRVERRGDRIYKPRTLLWERLLLSAASPLRKFLGKLRDDEEPAGRLFEFLPNLGFRESRDGLSGSVERVDLAPVGRLGALERADLARVAGRALALFSWLGLADLHWENLVLGRDATGRLVFGPLDVEMVLDDFELPTQTKLLPEADPDVAEACRHAAGFRRLLPFLGKPVTGRLLVTMVAAYRHALELLERHAGAVADILDSQSALREAPIRVCLRGTDEYVDSPSRPVWPPLLPAEREQLQRGDIPYFFRRYGSNAIEYFVDAALRESSQLPTRGDVPKLEPLLSVERGLVSPNRSKLLDEGSFALLGAFDHSDLRGRVDVAGVGVEWSARRLRLWLPSGELLESGRDLRGYVESLYLPCRCGEVRAPLVPAVTRCRSTARP